MTPLTRILPILILISFSNFSKSQHSNTGFEKELEYANYLLETGEYANAIYAFEKLNFAHPNNFDIQQKILVSHRMLGDYKKGFERFHSFYSSVDNLDPKISLEFSQYLFEMGFYEDCIDYLNRHATFNADDVSLLLTLCHSIIFDFESAKVSLSGIENQKLKKRLETLIQKHEVQAHKSPFLAATMSTFIPGLGKAYTHNWKDGLISFVFIGTSAWQSYAGFNKNGTRSIYGWIFGGMTAGFYLGNIYGSAKAADKRNYINRTKSINDFKLTYESIFS